METTKGPIYQMVENEIVKYRNKKAEYTSLAKSTDMVDGAIRSLQIVLPKIAELENEQTKRSV